jgi:branched-chain amino acid transport system substrate-binding protein
MYEEQFFKTLGKFSDYCITNVPWYNPKQALTQRVEKAFARMNPKDQMPYHALNVGFTFEAILVAADAFKRARTVEPKALAEAIRETGIKDRMMIGGPIRFNAKGQVEEQMSAGIQNFNLKPTVVLPASAAEAKPVFPVPGYKKA